MFSRGIEKTSGLKWVKKIHKNYSRDIEEIRKGNSQCELTLFLIFYVLSISNEFRKIFSGNISGNISSQESPEAINGL